MGKRNYLLAIALIFILAGCSTQKSVQIVSEGYKTTKINNASLVILPLSEKFVDSEVWENHFQFDSTNSSDISIHNRFLFFEYYGTAFSRVSTSNVKDLSTSTNLENVNSSIEYENVKLATDKEGEFLTFLAPKNGTLTIDNKEPDFVLFTQTLRWKNELKSQGTVIMGSENEYSVNINIKLKYLIWDNKNESIASYGVILKTESLMGVPKSPTYEKIATELAQDIIEASPIF
ncbi:MAG: hypothetical protein JXR11_00910 [Balneola sp.]